MPGWEGSRFERWLTGMACTAGRSARHWPQRCLRTRRTLQHRHREQLRVQRMGPYLHRPAALRRDRRPAHLRRVHHRDRHRVLPAAHHQTPSQHPARQLTPTCRGLPARVDMVGQAVHRHRHPRPAAHRGRHRRGAGPRGRQARPAAGLPVHPGAVRVHRRRASPAACSTGPTRSCAPRCTSCANPPINAASSSSRRWAAINTITRRIARGGPATRQQRRTFTTAS